MTSNLSDLISFGESFEQQAGDGYVGLMKPGFGWVVFTAPKSFFPGGKEVKDKAWDHARANGKGQPIPHYRFTMLPSSIKNREVDWVEPYHFDTNCYNKEFREFTKPSVELLEEVDPVEVDGENYFWVHIRSSVEESEYIDKRTKEKRTAQNWSAFIVKSFNSEEEAEAYAANLSDEEATVGFPVMSAEYGDGVDWEEHGKDIIEALTQLYDVSEHVDSFTSEGTDLGLPEAYLEAVWIWFQEKNS